MFPFSRFRSVERTPARGAGRPPSWVLLLLALIPPVAPAQAAADASAPVSLPQAVALASARAPMLEARRHALLAAREEAARAGALPDPMFGVGIDNLPASGGDAFDGSAEDMTMRRISLSQQIPSAAKRRAQTALAARETELAEAMSSAELLAVRRASAEAWIELWAAQREYLALQAQREQAGLAQRLARARAASGAGSVAEALAAAAAVLELDERLEAARAGEQAAQAGLARWLGDTAPVASAEAVDFTRLPLAEAALMDGIDRSGALLPASAQVEAAAAAIDAARADKRPDWNVGVAYGLRQGRRSDMLSLEVGIGLPLFARSRQDHGIAAREADYRATLAAREDLRRQQRAQLQADLARWHGLQRQVERYRSALLPLARDRSAAALAAYRAGAPLQPWLDARRDELDAEMAQVRTLGDLGRAWAALAYLLPESTP